jgi:2-C-methyl-D-erythritol 4-phosphate cytidylyltransferase
MTETVIVVAGGKGTRFGAVTPKQFLSLKSKPVLQRTLEAFFMYNQNIECILVLPEQHIPTWKELIKEHNFTLKHKIVVGGEERFHSVKNGLKQATGQLIAVHDGVRPLVSKEAIERCFKSAQEKGSGIPVLPVVDSLRKVDGLGKSEAVIRSEYRIVQTPQCFAKDLLNKAYELSFSSNFTDDASVVEALGETVYLVEGNSENIKITTPFDLKVAEIFF